MLFLGWFEDEHSIYLAMEYIEYGDLGQFIKEYGAHAKANVKVIAVQLLEGLVVLHGRGICHRDLKPQVRRLSMLQVPKSSCLLEGYKLNQTRAHSQSTFYISG